ncbi:hypothetical protein VOLCADRAFT_91413 [Volvox carteri f. nagariensis]|uniref:3'-5' exonuclease domain-containing protein n=1 Tax=Volvox carteri f. nagariensis TaxID=3068 RepID=D8TX05_VOLCA|nr:uncharacterized protein VOLCADRAFT_91413 [Volvox carteri f. nagariensis]EFJ47826.1 hypothetical protein VOLCADRAFT_91413 [Volvox carteri f. nagariensis]|eukprot:XP_002950932.1 hypothetical protein VOLCADRAFT_91413 [Volvox carteri f. nagariensis]
MQAAPPAAAGRIYTLILKPSPLTLTYLSARCGRSPGTGGRSSTGGGGSGGGGGVSIWLVDVAALGGRAFQHRSGLDGVTSLKRLLEDPVVIKYLYDVRRDAEALSSEYGVRLRGVVDLQLADVAVRQAEGGLRAGGWVEGLVSALSRGLAARGRASAPPGMAADLAAATATSRRYHEGNNTQVWIWILNFGLDLDLDLIRDLVLGYRGISMSTFKTRDLEIWVLPVPYTSIASFQHHIMHVHTHEFTECRNVFL